jgi:hypothetical protein
VSYIFYDRVEARLDRKHTKRLRLLSWVSGISLIVFILNALFVNTIFPNMEYFAVHRTLLYLSPIVFAVSVTAAMIIYFKGLFSQHKAE